MIYIFKETSVPTIWFYLVSRLRLTSLLSFIVLNQLYFICSYKLHLFFIAYSGFLSYLEINVYQNITVYLLSTVCTQYNHLNIRTLFTLWENLNFNQAGLCKQMGVILKYFVSVWIQSNLWIKASSDWVKNWMPFSTGDLYSRGGFF